MKRFICTISTMTALGVVPVSVAAEVIVNKKGQRIECEVGAITGETVELIVDGKSYEVKVVTLTDASVKRIAEIEKQRSAAKQEALEKAIAAKRAEMEMEKKKKEEAEIAAAAETVAFEERVKKAAEASLVFRGLWLGMSEADLLRVVKQTWLRETKTNNGYLLNIVAPSYKDDRAKHDEFTTLATDGTGKKFEWLWMHAHLHKGQVVALTVQCGARDGGFDAQPWLDAVKKALEQKYGAAKVPEPSEESTGGEPVEALWALHQAKYSITLFKSSMAIDLAHRCSVVFSDVAAVKAAEEAEKAEAQRVKELKEKVKGGF